MKILENLNSNAYMIRNDGKAIPCIQHIYGSDSVIDETLYASEWLYNNTQYSDTKAAIIQLIAVWGQSLPGSGDTTIKIIRDMRNKPYKVLSERFINTISNSVNKHADGDIDKLNKSVNLQLNQEFLRARYGGMYNTNSSSREMVFRISSVGFNWYNIIWEFVTKNKRYIDRVTIVRDEESTGTFGYYKTNKGELYKEIPVSEFIAERGNPVIESSGNIYDINGIDKIILNNLRSGSSIQFLENLNINQGRLYDKIERLRYLETFKMVILTTEEEEI